MWGRDRERVGAVQETRDVAEVQTILYNPTAAVPLVSVSGQDCAEDVAAVVPPVPGRGCAQDVAATDPPVLVFGLAALRMSQPPSLLFLSLVRAMSRTTWWPSYWFLVLQFP